MQMLYRLPRDVLDRINVAFSATGLTQDKAASKIGTTRRTFVRFLSGEQNISTYLFYRFCIVCNVSADYLLFGKE